MKIIFNKEKAGSFGKDDDSNNTAEKLIERTRSKLTKLGEFIGADYVEYVDLDKMEKYIITKEGKTLTLMICGNPIDGGWMSVD